MSHFLGSNLHNRRSESQEQISKIENIQRYTENDSMLKVEQFNPKERESVMSNSRINKYLGESFEENEILNYKSNQDKVAAFKETKRGNPYDKNLDNKPTLFNRNTRMHSPGEDIVIEDIEMDNDLPSSNQKHYESQAKPVSSKLSECTFKADEIFNDRSERESSNRGALNKKTREETKISSVSQRQPSTDDRSAITKKKEESGKIISSGGNNISLANQNKVTEVAKSNRQSTSANPNQQLSSKGSVPQNRNPEYKVQLGPIGGDTLDEESEEEEYESELSIEDNMYFNSSTAQKPAIVKESESKIKRGLDTNSDWDEENYDSKNNKYKNYNPGMKPVKNEKKSLKMMDDLDLDDI